MTDYTRTGATYAAGIGIQTATDTYKSPEIYIPFAKCEPDHGITDKPLEGHVGGRGTEIGVIRDKVLPKMTLDSPCWPEAGMEHMLYGVLGAKASPSQQGGTAAYLHTFTENANLPYFSITHWAGATIGEPEAYKNIMVDDVKIDYKEGAIDMNATMYTAPIDLSQAKPTATYTAAQPFVFKDFICKIGGYGSFTFADADVNVGTEVITSATHKMNTGDAVQFSNQSGALPTGLSAATTYYVNRASADTFLVYDTRAHAITGGATGKIDITAAAGGGTHTCEKGIPIQDTTVTAANIEIKNNIIAKAVANNTHDPMKIPGKLEVTGRVEFPMQNLDELRNYIGGTAQATTVGDDIRYRSLTFQLQGATIASTYKYDLTFTIPKVALMPVKITHDDNQPVTYGFDFRAFRNSSDVMVTASAISKLTSII